jgi:hypothetical protein
MAHRQHHYFLQGCVLLISIFHESFCQDPSLSGTVIIDTTYVSCPKGQQCCNGVCCYSWMTCNPVGYDRGCYYAFQSMIGVSQTTSACKTCDPLTLNITADDAIMELYIDGSQTMPAIPPQKFDWTVAMSIPIPAESKVVAIKSRDVHHSVASNLASVGYNYLLTDSSWTCSATETAGWMNTAPSTTVSLWPNAVANELNPGYPYIHGYSSIAGISRLASWIWTSNNGYSQTPIEPVVYCRGNFPSNSCNLDSGGNCSNLCAAEGKVCCNCRMLNDGPTKVCSCCPAGFRCCGPAAPRMTYGCCREDSVCSKDGASCIKTTYVLGKPVSTSTFCGTEIIIPPSTT